MTSERTVLMEKARAKRQRRADRKMAKKSLPPAHPQDADSNASLVEKVVDLAQEAVAQVGELVKTAASKLTGSAE